ncbi:MAG: hypothetical protein HQL11_04470, partial [Candidatus Omnitrophica bacterium]|nr:hypothetical protein [Candidatus Omnitrophota bacterium]
RWACWCARLKDKYGDYGLIAVVILELLKPVIRIDTWLMSCRVLCRGVETFMMNTLFEYAEKHRFDAIRGSYFPTAKNGMVRDFYKNFGFVPDPGDPSGADWQQPVSTYRAQPVYFVHEETDL